MKRFLLLLLLIASAYFNAVASNSSQQIPFIKYDALQYEETLLLLKDRQLGSVENHITVSSSSCDVEYGKSSFSYKSTVELFKNFPNKDFLNSTYFILDLNMFYQYPRTLMLAGDLIKYIGYFDEDKVLYLRQNDEKSYNIEQLLILEYGSIESFHKSYIQELRLSLKYNDANGLINSNLLNAKNFLKEDYFFYKDCYPQDIGETSVLLLNFVEKQLGYKLSDEIRDNLLEGFGKTIPKTLKFNILYYYNLPVSELTHTNFKDCVYPVLSSNLTPQECISILSAMDDMKKERFIAYRYLLNAEVGNINKSTGKYYEDVEEFQEVKSAVFSDN